MNSRNSNRTSRNACWRAASTLVLIGFLLTAPPFSASAELLAGAGQADITPPVGTPSAGYSDRMGRRMEGVHDRLLATALVIDNGDKMIAFVGVDHLGYGKDMVRAVRRALVFNAGTRDCDVYLGASHTHSGGGAHMKLPPIIAQFISGTYNRDAYRLYIDGAVQAIKDAVENLAPARVGIGYGHEPSLHSYRGDHPPYVVPPHDVAVIKVTTPEGAPVAVLFNYAAHATVLGADNLLFSSDFVGPARDHLAELIGGDVQPIFINGAQGDLSPSPPSAQDPFVRCDLMGTALAEEVWSIWNATETCDTLKIETKSRQCGLKRSELNAIVLNDLEAFVTVPGEMTCMYDIRLKQFGGWLGFNHVSILGLTNGAQGYIVTPESWRHGTYEALASLGGKYQGQVIEETACTLLHLLEPGRREDLLPSKTTAGDANDMLPNEEDRTGEMTTASSETEKESGEGLLAEFLAGLQASLTENADQHAPDTEVTALSSKMIHEPALPFGSSGKSVVPVRADSVLAVRLRSESKINPDSIWAPLPEYADGEVSVTWQPARDGDLRDIWVLYKPNEAWYLEDLLELTVEADTESGKPVRPSVYQFQVESVEEYAKRGENPAQPVQLRQPPSLDGEASDEAVVTAVAHRETELLAEGLHEPLLIGPECVYAQPQRVWLPLPEGLEPAAARLYYYHPRGEDRGWYPAENVEGWLVPDSYLKLDYRGVTYLGFLVRHAGIVQLGIPNEVADK